MKVLVMQISIRVSWVQSLKEKRMIVLSITQRLRRKFGVSIGEMFEQDNHKLIGLGLSAVCGNNKIGDSLKEKVITFIEENCEGDIIDIYEELIEV